MMYSEKIVACIKVNGKILRESGDTVTFPFGSEYSILLKNLHSVRAQVSVSIDGEDVAGRLVIPANSSLELERYIRNGNLESGNRFKFIERTAGIEEHRGIKTDDGLIRVEAWKELLPQYVPPPMFWNYYFGWNIPYTPTPREPYKEGWLGSHTSGLDNQIRCCNMSQSVSGSNQMSETSCNFSATNDSGITVPGSQSNQKFHTVSDFQLEPNSSVIVLRLRGQVAGVKASRPVTVDIKPVCTTCGKKSKSGNTFCGACGTALQLI